MPGFYERTQDQHWKQFTPFASLPNLDWNDPNLKFLDLTGDGHADILITEDGVFTWYLSLAEGGFSLGEKVRQALDEETGPRLVFTDGTQSIYLADLSGDGLTDLVRIRNGEVCYWPNLGYGRFGAKVTMDDAPLFDYSDQFNQQRIRLADIDGSGTTDIIYLGGSGVHIYFNQSGNSWSKGRTLTQFPRVDNLSSVMVADLKGNGTACLIWSSPLSGNARQQMQYIDLMGGQKPHLLVAVKNNLGVETCVHYVPSTKFYTEDRKAGKPWITRIPFPVHVVEKVEVYDRISRNRFATHYAYHHGYFDGFEREFRGFGMVEQWDTEEFAAFGESDAFPAGNNIDEVSHVPPVLTKTWFHTGSYLDESRISRLFEDEYYRESNLSEDVPGLTDEQLGTMLLDDTVLPGTMRLADGTQVPFNLSAEEAREACRALKGSVLRQEIYALDGTDEEDRPYSVSERNYTIELLQPRGSNKHSVFFAHPRETIDFHYERKLYEIGDHKLGDPRVSHSMTLTVDEFGNVLQSAAIGYGRRYDDPDPLLTDDDRMKQKRTLVTYTENRFTNSINQDDAYRIPLPCETKTYEILKVIPDANEPIVTNLFRFKEMVNKIHKASDGEHDISYEDIDAAGALEDVPYRRLIEHVRSLYRSNDLTGSLPPGELESLALPYENYKLAFTPGLLAQIYDDQVADPIDVIMTNEGRYVHSEGDDNWWIPSGQIFYSLNTNDSPAQELAFAQQHFFLPHRFRDPFDQETILTYDGYDLLMLESEDPLHNKVTAGERDAQGNIANKNNYRVLQPALVTDPNGNRSAVAFDALGMVVGTAMMGKPGENKGDSLMGFMPDLSEITILNYIRDPLADPHDILQKATTRLVYDLYPYYRTRDNAQPQPAVVYTLARETHDADLDQDQLTNIQHSFSYSDGFGREIQTKIQAEPGVVDGVPTDSRWVGTGWTIFNNKGKPVRQYEPFFDDTHDFMFGKEVGVSPILFYDPVERVVATLHPNNTYEKVVFDPWHQKTYDVNDTVAFDPRTDTDISGYVGEYFEQIAPEPDTCGTWLQQRCIDPLNPPEDIGLDPDKKAAVRTLVHADTPTIAFSDSLGRTFLTVAHNRFERRMNGDTVIIEEKYNTRVVFDIEDNQREVIDAKDRIVMRYNYDMLGSPIHQASMEAGERWMLNNVAGNPILTWDSRSFQRRMTYDAMQRPLELFVTDTNGAEFLAEKSEYGESKPDPEITNHRMKPWKVYDGAGVVVSDSFDFKGNLLTSTRQLLQVYKTQVNWLQNPQLETETFSSRTLYDALNRPILIIAPHSSRAGTKLNVTQPVYNEANLLERMEVWLEQDAEPEGLLDPNTATQHFVTNIDYNAKGQRELFEYGNGVRTTYTYDPLTFRLTNLRTMRGTEPLQDMFYTYDPVGNITVIRDDAQQTIFFNGQVVKPDADYKYDAIYRLIQSHGREHIGQASIPHTTWNDRGRVNLAHPNDGQAMRNYFEFYEYDEVGNILRFDHKANNGNWIRAYDYDEISLIETDKNNNRLSQTIVHPDGQQPISEPYNHDSHGNMTTMPHLSQMEWDFEDQLHRVEKSNEMAYYVYGAADERVRKVVEKNDGTLIEERIYLGGFEIFRKRNLSGIILERETLHIMDDQQRIAMLETRTVDTQNVDRAPRQLVRYQLGNQLGSASLEMDDRAQVISYEEYYPYGSTSYQALRKNIEVPVKRYRYTSKERDEETGLNYHGARYCIPWLGRWTKPDPLYLQDATNVYIYALNNPVIAKDPTGGPAWFIPVVIYLGYKALSSAAETGVEAGIAKATDDKDFSVGGTFLKNMVVNSTIGLIPGTSEAKIGVKVAVYGSKLALRTTADATYDTALGKGDFTENFVKSGVGNVGGDAAGALLKKGGGALIKKFKGSTDEATEAASKKITQAGSGTPVVSPGVNAAAKASVKVASQQLDANIFSALLNPADVGHAAAVAFASAHKTAGLTINRHTYMKLLQKYSKHQLKAMREQYRIKLLRKIELPELGAAASRLENAFAGTGRAISAEDARVAASAFLRKETLATADLQFFKRAQDLGLSVKFIGSGNAAVKASAYVPQKVVIPVK